MTWPARAGIATAAAGLVWLVGYAQGRGRRPPAEVRTVDHVVYKDRVEYRDRVVTVAGKAQVIRRVIRVAVAPDGTKTREVTEDKRTDTHQAAAASAQASRATSSETVREVFVRVAQRAPWALQAMAGVNAAGVVGADRRWWLGGSMTHSFIGPLRWGVAATYREDQGVDVGLVLGVEF